MDSLRDAFSTVEDRRTRLEVYTDDDESVAELERQFSTRNVEVDSRPARGFDDPGFVILRTATGQFQAGLGLSQFDAVLSPTSHPPWELSRTDPTELFGFLEGTLFAAYDRPQLLVAAREIEERAWRVADGRLYTGFQRDAAADQQTSVYEALADRGTLTVTVFVGDGWTGPIDDVPVVQDAADEIGSFWFVVFDGAETGVHACALVAEERQPGEYFGFWTYDPDDVASIVDYLERAYDV